ncbi:MAG TPA: hypothetical protein VKF83_02715 [Stellaceae bacterium]|nr:hypothetical protein [Stellaceae bacterium]
MKCGRWVGGQLADEEPDLGRLERSLQRLRERYLARAAAAA